MLLEEAAAARASDVVFENDGGLCRVHGIVNDRKLQLAAPMPADEGRELMGFLFHCKDEGSAQTSYQRSAFQGFSVRAGGQVPLPATVSALRCQRGPHEPDGDHLFARLFYRDRIEKGTTLESLGFSPEEAALFSEIRMSLRGGIFLGGTAGDGKSIHTLRHQPRAPDGGGAGAAQRGHHRGPGGIPDSRRGADRGAHHGLRRGARQSLQGRAHALLPGASGVRHGVRD